MMPLRGRDEATGPRAAPAQGQARVQAPYAFWDGDWGCDEAEKPECHGACRTRASGLILGPQRGPRLGVTQVTRPHPDARVQPL